MAGSFADLYEQSLNMPTVPSTPDLTVPPHLPNSHTNGYSAHASSNSTQPPAMAQASEANGTVPTRKDQSTSLPKIPTPSPMADYKFPEAKLHKVMADSTKSPLLLVACGSFSPITNLHLRMFVMVADHVRFNTNFEIIGRFLSPVSDAYQKVGLASAEDRIRMCEIAAESSAWLMVDPWEAIQQEYTRTALVLDHFDHEINTVRGGVATASGERKHVQIALLAGADLIGTMSTPGVWSDDDLEHILGRYGAFIVERTGTNIEEALANLQRWKHNIYVIPQLIQNDVSSTKIRQFLRKEMSVQYLIPAPVIDYIEEHGLYEDESIHHTHRRGKSAEVGGPPIS